MRALKFIRGHMTFKLAYTLLLQMITIWMNNCSFIDILPSALCNHALTTISSYFMIEFLLFTYRRTKRFWFSLGK